MSSNILAGLATIGLGLALIPWANVAKRMPLSNFIILLGLTYAFFGILLKISLKEPLRLNSDNLPMGILTTSLYAVSITFVSLALAQPEAKRTVVGAITACFPVITGVAAALIARELMTFKEMLWMIGAIVCIAGLSLSGKN